MKKILIVDDISTFIDRERSILSRLDFRIFTAMSAEEALALHRAEKMDLIITDLDIPKVGGDSLCSIIRQDPELKHVSILVVCSNRKADINRASLCKANAYITKPLQPAQLLDKVGQLLEIHERKSYRVILRVKVLGKDTSESFLCSSQNISVSGILIETDKILEKGVRISCSFFLPRSEQIVVEGEVMRIVKNPDSTPQYGIKYHNLVFKHKAAIEEFIKSRSGKK
jgi:two-component system, chemotaxis family, chemotaxis protein CheY